MIAAFNDGISAPLNATLLAHPYPEAPIAITSVNSDAGVGTCLAQFVNGHWQPLAFFGKQLRDPERNYNKFDREMLVLYLAIRHFRFLVEGRNFTVFTDHKPLVLCLKYPIHGPRDKSDNYHLFHRLPLKLSIFLAKTILLLIAFQEQPLVMCRWE